MLVKIVQFPLTKVAAIEHFGPSETECESVAKLIHWRKENGYLNQQKYQCYGIHYTNPKSVAPELHHVDFCISMDDPVLTNNYGVMAKTIPALRCAKVRDIGSRSNNKAIIYLLETWLPNSNEEMGVFAPIFHYVNVGSNLCESEMITDVYLPLK